MLNLIRVIRPLPLTSSIVRVWPAAMVRASQFRPFGSMIRCVTGHCSVVRYGEARGADGRFATSHSERIRFLERRRLPPSTRSFFPLGQGLVGSGAQAVAVISNGVVIAVKVLDAGPGYR
jgi:hypothetical protein